MPDLVTYKAPWGGVNSSLPEDKIEVGDFSAMSNFIIRDGEVRTRPTMIDPVVQFLGSSVTFISIDTFASLGFRNVANGALFGRRFIVTALGKFYEEDSINGFLLKGTCTNTANVYLVPTVTYNGSVYGSVGNGSFKWDGTTFTANIFNWVSGGYYFGVLANHGILANTQEGANNFGQRVRWSAVGNLDQMNPALDNTAGVQDLLEIDDVITGLITNTAGIGIIVRTSGLTQMIATGSGSKPWDFLHILNRGAGCFYSGSLDSYGDWSAYVGLDDIYSVDNYGQLSRIGGKAKSRIFADIASINTGTFNDFLNPPNSQAIPTIIGSCVPLLNRGYPYLCYILALPMGTNGLTPPNSGTIFWIYYKDLNIWERFVVTNGWLQCRIRTVLAGGQLITMAPMRRSRFVA